MKSKRHFVWELLLPLAIALLAYTATHGALAQTDTPPATPTQVKQGMTIQDWITQIESERDAAYNQLTAGDLSDGAASLTNSLRNLPAEHPELMDTAYGSLQLLLYTMEYLMDETVRTQFVQQHLEPEQNDIDKFIIAAYNIYIGQDTPEKTVATQDLLAAAATTNPFARIGALFILSDPYFFDNADFTRQSQEILAAEYPDLAITLEAHRYTVYGARKSGAEALTTATNAFAAKSGSTRNFAQDPVIAASIEAAPQLNAKSEAAAISAFTRALEASQDWKARFGLLLMIEPYGHNGHEAEVVRVCEAIATTKSATTIATPDAVRAQLMLLKLARGQWDQTPGTPTTRPTGMQWADALLEARWTKNPYERCLYEDVMKGLMNCAKQLDEIGKPDLAIQIYEKLAKQYPNSLVSRQCETELTRIKEGKPATRQ
ncbi:MAG TPA: hypothetical protein PK869_00275 [Candidatus Hydrogenedentes bacterium]|nr:hypothetical protein [Candidatus Hydrogenedentota bacterium]